MQEKIRSSGSPNRRGTYLHSAEVLMPIGGTPARLRVSQMRATTEGEDWGLTCHCNCHLCLLYRHSER